MLNTASFAIVLAAVLSVSMAYGVTLPVLPFLLERVLGPGEGAAVSRHTGWLTGLFTFAAFFMSPAWGALSDRLGRRGLMVIGLVGSAVGLAALDAAGTLGAIYAARIGSGLLSAAVLPAALAYVTDASDLARRPKRFALIASATTLGFLLGPVLGSALSSMVISPPSNMRIAWVVMPDSPFFVTAVGNLAAALAVAWLPVQKRGGATAARQETMFPAAAAGIRQALLLTMLVVFAIGSVEVGMTLLAKEALAFGPQGISGLFLVCSLVMVAVQIWVFPPLLEKLGMHRLVRGAFVLVAGGQVLVFGAASVASIGASVAFASIGVGILIPALATRISSLAASDQGWALGRQTAAANLGQAIAAALAGVLFVLAPGGPFIAAAVASLAGAAMAGRAGAPAP